MNDKGFVIDTPQGISDYQTLAMRSALRLEVKTGMKMSRGISVLKLVNSKFDRSFKRKQQALDFLDAYIVENMPQLD
jgi:hypothetical protein